MKPTLVLALVFTALNCTAHNALLPQPQKVRYGAGRLPLANIAVTVSGTPAVEDRFAANELSQILKARKGGANTITLKRTGAVDAMPLKDEQPGPNSREAYKLRITPTGGEITARSSAGLYWAVQTMRQLIEGQGAAAFLPEVEIEDWPVLAYRGVMMDLSHGALPTEDEIRRQIDFLARWKGNQYYFYSEFTIETKGLDLVNPTARYSQEQVKRLVAYARERHVDIVPCLEYYGHLHDLMRLERYADLGALKHGGDLNPRNERVKALLADWVKQMATLFPSPWFHIGLDEPWELERAGSAAAGGIPPGELYIEHLRYVASLARGSGKRVLFWADVAVGAALFEKYPEIASKLPPETVAVPWHYDVEKSYERMLAPFVKAKVPQVVGTGIWAWDTIVPNFAVTFGNIDGFVSDGRKAGAIGIVNTNWSDDAQILYRMTLPGIAYGAVAAWQNAPIDRKSFFAAYSARMYAPAVAAEVAPALAALEQAATSIKAALGGEDMFRMWDDPFAPDRLQRARAHQEDLRKARLAAEDAWEHLQRAVALSGDRYSLPSLLLGARMVDYAGMKFLFALEIAESFEKLGPTPKSSDLHFWLGRGSASRNHSRMGDMMDTITDLREQYRAAWMQEYTQYRLGTALARFDAECEYWRRAQAKTWEIIRTFRNGSPAPKVEVLRP